MSLYVAALLAMAAAFVPGSRDDFFSYYALLRWSADTGNPPYQPWSGEPKLSPDSPPVQYALEHWNRTPLPFLYPPTVLPFLRPFSLIPNYKWAEGFWRLGDALILFVLACVLAGMAGPHGSPAIAAMLLLLCDPVREGIGYGQVSLLIALGVCLFLRELERNNGTRAGIALAAASAIKIYPAFWIPLLYFNRKSNREFLLGFSATLAIIGFVSLLVWGSADWPAFQFQVLEPMSRMPPKGSVSIWAWFGQANAVTTSLILAILGVAALASCLNLRCGIERRRRARLGYTVALHLAMPLVWNHYLTLVCAMLVPELLRLNSSRLRRRPISSAWLIFVFVLLSSRESSQSLATSALGMSFTTFKLLFGWLFWPLVAIGLWLARRWIGFYIVGVIAIIFSLLALDFFRGYFPDWKLASIGLALALLFPYMVRPDLQLRRLPF